MSGQKAKKLRKECRNQVKKYMDNSGQFEMFMLIVKPRPWWMHKRLWIWGIRKFINIQEDWNYDGDKIPDK